MNLCSKWFVFRLYVFIYKCFNKDIHSSILHNNKPAILHRNLFLYFDVRNLFLKFMTSIYKHPVFVLFSVVDTPTTLVPKPLNPSFWNWHLTTCNTVVFCLFVFIFQIVYNKNYSLSGLIFIQSNQTQITNLLILLFYPLNVKTKFHFQYRLLKYKFQFNLYTTVNSSVT